MFLLIAKNIYPVRRYMKNNDFQEQEDKSWLDIVMFFIFDKFLFKCPL